MSRDKMRIKVECGFAQRTDGTPGFFPSVRCSVDGQVIQQWVTEDKCFESGEAATEAANNELPEFEERIRAIVKEAMPKASVMTVWKDHNAGV